MCCFKMNGLLILVFLSNLHDPQRFRPNIGSLVDDDEVRLKGFFIRFGHDHIRFPLFSGEGDLVMGVGIVGFGYRSADHAEHGAIAEPSFHLQKWRISTIVSPGFTSVCLG